MRIRTFTAIAALVAALFTGACTDEGPDCSAKPQPKECASRKVVTDMTVVQGYVNSARTIMGGDFTAKVVPAGTQSTCSDGTEVDGGSDEMKACDGGTKLLIPTDIQYAFGGYNRRYVAYQLVLQATQAMSAAYPTDQARACAAAYVTAKQENLNAKTAGEVDKALSKELWGDEKQAASTGVHLALNDKKVKLCAS